MGDQKKWGDATQDKKNREMKHKTKKMGRRDQDKKRGDRTRQKKMGRGDARGKKMGR